MLVKDIMTKDVITVSPDSMLRDAGRILREKRISGIPVVETSGRIVGIITVNDIFRILEEIFQWQNIEKKATGLNLSNLVGKERLNVKVRDIMTKNVYTLDENKDVGEVIRLMFTKKIHTIPVTKNDLLAGVVGKRDIVYNCF